MCFGMRRIALKIKSISIENLFGQFDYTIPFNDEGITILTGPNGYGKTTILNMVYSIAKLTRNYFDTTKFDNISVEYDDGYRLDISKNNSGHVIFSNDFPEAKGKYLISLYYIKDQRLTPYISIPQNSNDLGQDPNLLRSSGSLTVENYAKVMRTLLSQKKDIESKLAEKLTATQFNRIKECTPLNEKEYKERFEVFLQKYHQLEMLGIYPDLLQYADYTENRKYLTVFLEDFEQRTNIYDDIIFKSTLFNDMLEEKYLNNKKIAINKDKGFSVLTDSGQELNLSDISSGEQQEIIFLYELLFKADEDSLVLIDEPETSMHVEWQRQFIPDLKRIRQVNNKLSFLMATHSPQIIGNDWDLTVDLFDLSKGNVKSA
jgi:predicted ATP-binding protein involved in virulence